MGPPVTPRWREASGDGMGRGEGVTGEINKLVMVVLATTAAAARTEKGARFPGFLTELLTQCQSRKWGCFIG